MSDTVQTAYYCKMTVPDRPGTAAELLQALRREGVNLLAFSGFPRGRKGQLDLIVTDPATLKAAARRARLKITGPKICFVVNGKDRPGAVADLLTRLADARINVTALDAVCSGDGRYGALLWVKPRDVKKAAQVLAGA